MRNLRDRENEHQIEQQFGVGDAGMLVRHNGAKQRAAMQKQGKAECSLVSRVNGAPDISFGHVIDLPHFGKIFLGELMVDRENGKPSASKDAPPTPETYTFHLTMIRLEMGCLAQGKVKIVALDTNGGGKGGSPRPIPPPPPPPPPPRR